MVQSISNNMLPNSLHTSNFYLFLNFSWSEQLWSKLFFPQCRNMHHLLKADRHSEPAGLEMFFFSLDCIRASKFRHHIVWDWKETDFYLVELPVSPIDWAKANGGCGITTFTLNSLASARDGTTCQAKAAEYLLLILIYLKKFLCVAKE